MAGWIAEDEEGHAPPSGRGVRLFRLIFAALLVALLDLGMRRRRRISIGGGIDRFLE